IFAVWEQVRNALLATQLSLGNRTIVATTMGYTQMLDAVRNRVSEQSADIRSDFSRLFADAIADGVEHLRVAHRRRDDCAVAEAELRGEERVAHLFPHRED